MAMWPFRSKQPKLLDAAMADLAAMFVSYPTDPMPCAEILKSAHLDFGLASLGIVDQYLEMVRSEGMEGELLVKFVLRCGAYVGEVIRQHSTEFRKWHWLDYDTALGVDSRLVSLGKCLGTAAVLWDGEDGFCFPLAKVGKYLQNGSEDSVKFFAEVLLAGPPGSA